MRRTVQSGKFDVKFAEAKTVHRACGKLGSRQATNVNICCRWQKRFVRKNDIRNSAVDSRRRPRCTLRSTPLIVSPTSEALSSFNNMLVAQRFPCALLAMSCSRRNITSQSRRSGTRPASPCVL